MIPDTNDNKTNKNIEYKSISNISENRNIISNFNKYSPITNDNCTTEHTVTNLDNKFNQNINKLNNIKSIDVMNNLYPYCIVWTKLPLISFIFPFIGHTGICDSNGKIYDFAGSEYIGEDELAFGKPYKYVRLENCINWDKGIKQANLKYEDQEHSLFCNNCHSHVACALNYMNYKSFNKYNMIHIWWFCLVKSRYVSWIHLISNYSFLIIILLVYIINKFL